MLVIPAIDLIDGKCVRLSQGDFANVDVYGNDPVAYACRWEQAGAEVLHVVDLDGARLGRPQRENLAAIERIAGAVRLNVEVGGGIRTLEAVDRILNLGADRAVLGTALAQDDQLARTAFGRFGERVVVGIDARGGRVAVRGWQEQLDVTAADFAVRMQELGARRIIFTDIGRDGMLAGVNLAALRDILLAVDVPVIASGGVTSLNDIHGLAALPYPNLEGAIVGKALYAGALDLPEAIAAARRTAGE